MKAIVWHSRGDIRYEEVPDAPAPGHNEVRVRVAYAGICGTDLEEYLAGPIYIPVEKPHPLTHAQAPLILGHEFSGIVTDIGDEVSQFRVGDAVAADTLIYCGKCEACRNHLYNLCSNMAALGLSANGGLAERVTAKADTFIQIPNALPLDEAALSEPLAVAVRGLRRAAIRPGDQLLVMGAGTIGLLVLQAARVMGVSTVTVVEPSPFRADLARTLGATEVIPPEDLPSVPTFDRAIDCSGKPAAQVAALNALKVQGRLVLIGVPTALTQFNTLDILNYEREIVGSLSHIVDEDFRTAIQFLADKRVNAKPLISRRWPLSHGEEAFRLLSVGETDVLKILMKPGEIGL
ncbi:2,3-butanediol dehydrogenase [Alicyclobacillaceae bacterium I2511]|nr:2,3-butanediol dehydrogenase [Alicyclobacillaceae bacterium I2511]